LINCQKNIREKIVSAIRNIPLDDVKPLKGKYQGFYRLRVSNYRILFKREGDTIYVYRIDVRGDVYKLSKVPQILLRVICASFLSRLAEILLPNK